MRHVAFALLLCALPLAAQQRAGNPPVSPDPWFGTFSIIAFDPATNELGIGVQSRAFGAGAAVPYAKPGVGAVATQASANRQYGPKAIALLEQGVSVEEVVKRIADDDPGRDTRQVAVIDAKGRSAVYTGKRVLDRNKDPQELQEALAINPRSETLHYALAQRYAQAGDTAKALEWLRTAITRQPRVSKPRAAADPIFEPLRELPAFTALVSR